MGLFVLSACVEPLFGPLGVIILPTLRQQNRDISPSVRASTTHMGLQWLGVLLDSFPRVRLLQLFPLRIETDPSGNPLGSLEKIDSNPLRGS